MNLNDLPNEILEKIFINIKNYDNVQLEQVCKKWYKICSIKFVKNIRNQCICLSVGNKVEKIRFCKAKSHPCICILKEYYSSSYV